MGRGRRCNGGKISDTRATAGLFQSLESAMATFRKVRELLLLSFDLGLSMESQKKTIFLIILVSLKGRMRPEPHLNKSSSGVYFKIFDKQHCLFHNRDFHGYKYTRVEQGKGTSQ